MDMELSSDTYLHLYTVDQPFDQDEDRAFLFEYISLDMVKIGKYPGLSLHVSGWASLDVADEAEGDTDTGSLSGAYAYYRYNDNHGQAKLGRFLLSEGTCFEALDGVHVKQSFGRGGLSLFGGSPNPDGTSSGERGNLLTGARVFFLSPGMFEVGLNFLTEDGDFRGEEREEAGTDLWFRPTESLEFTGQVLYNLTTSGLAFDDFSLLLKPSSRVQVTLGSSGFRYGDLFQAVTNPAFSESLVNPEDEVRVVSGRIQWSPAPRMDLYGAVRSTDHREDDPGDTDRSEIGVNISFPGLIEKVGVQTAFQSGERIENEYSEIRGFVMLASGSLTFSVDAMALAYGEEISGEDKGLQVVGSAGWSPAGPVAISGDLRFTQSPVFEEDLAVVLRANYLFEN
jgi:hypothetical protein